MESDLKNSQGLQLASVEWLLAHHEAKLPYRAEAVSALEISPGSTVFDIASGPCLWSSLIAEKVGPTGRVIAVDLDLTHLAFGKRLLRCFERPVEHARSELVCASFDYLPLCEASADALFLSNALAYAANPLSVLRSLKRLVRPGGLLVCRQWDNLVTVFSPVSPTLLLEIQFAASKSLSRRSRSLSFDNYLGERLNGLFLEAGFDSVRTTSTAIQMLAPLSEGARTYLSMKGRWFGEQARSRVSRAIYFSWMKLFDPGSECYILNRSDFYFCTLEVQSQSRV